MDRASIVVKWSAGPQGLRNMKVFISSLIRDLEPLRDAAAAGIRTLGHQSLRAEDLGHPLTHPSRPAWPVSVTLMQWC